MESSEAGTSSGSEYQVFLSFRGPDTRSDFTDCLYHSLTDVGICVFRDDEELCVGERIDGVLQRAIENSMIYIPVFSPTYASSKWCLRELTRIMGSTSKTNENKEILPIFFNVEPKDLKMEDGLYHKAILILQDKNNLSIEEVNSWRKALTEVDEIKGWKVKIGDSQGELIKLVTVEVLKRLKIKEKPVTECLIGIDDQVVAVKKLLDIDFGGVRLIQIHGMGGIGKTTLAKVVFNQLHTHFGKCCYFLEDVREKSSRANGLVELQKKLLSEIGNAAGTESVDEINYGMTRIEGTLRKKKVFIVLDDVDRREQVEKLVGKGALCSGSRVLITTRNIDVLPIPEQKYEMKLMNSNHALELFSKHAFNKDSPLDDRYDIANEIVNATGRLPLTIEVIGSFLYYKTQELWNETLEKLGKAPWEGVSKKLRISYDALTLYQQQNFLDIAFFFIGKEKANAIHMWEDFDFSPSREIEVLRSMSLIKIVKDNEFWMHDQLRDLGREIVRQENLMNLEERSRLWSKEEVLDAIRTKKMKKVQAMKLELFPTEVSIKSEEIRRFENLRFLRLDGGTFVGNLMDCFPNLRWIYWNASGLKCKLTNMCLKKVVVIEFYFIDGIDDMKLWRLIKEARKLKVLTLCECNHITRTPDLSGCSTLEKLTFMTCRGLRKIDSSIGKLKCLIKLKFGECYQLEGLPEEIGDLQNLEHFYLKNCYGIKGLPDSIYKWKSLRELHLSIQGPVELSAAIRKLGNLEVLWIVVDLKGQLPSEIGLLPQLQQLVLRGCNEIRELLALPISLTHLAVSSTSLRVISGLSNLTNLVELDLSIEFDIDERGKIHTSDLRWIGRLSKLEELCLHLLHVPAPTELASLSRHDQLELSGLNLQPFTQLPSSLSDLTLESFKSIALISSNLKSLSNLQLVRSQMQEIKLDGLQLPNLTVLCLDYCGPLERFMLSSMTKLKDVSVEDCPKLNEIHIAGVLQSLEKLHINGCESFTRLVYVDIQLESSHESSLILASGVFNELRSLLLQDCPKILGIQVVGALESLKKLVLFSCQHLQSLGLSNLKNLKSLCIILCHELRIVEGLDKLEFLNKLSVADCLLLESLIDVSTTQLPNECRLYIGCCPKLRGLKQGFTGCVECFKRYKEEESVPAVSTDPLIIWHPPMVSRAESSAQAQIRVPGKMEELLAPFEEEECVGCIDRPIDVWAPIVGFACREQRTRTNARTRKDGGTPGSI